MVAPITRARQGPLQTAIAGTPNMMVRCNAFGMMKRWRAKAVAKLRGTLLS
jgi:hypothetical protein